ncbi:MAG: hypothetical protein KBD48_00910 [Candidatus Pacebacteria bacterium]|nr:hypothetical protein [Candidatus Paceibacterota bacterium]
MKKKHYELIGKEIKIIFKKSGENEYIKDLAINLSEAFTQTSSTFDKERFLETCGIKIK